MRSRKRAATRSIAGIACTATAFRAPATGRRPRFCIPLPRDYRKGIFKFTSTPSGAKPAPRRSAPDDQERPARHVDAGVSTPLLTESEIEQVIDYVIFLSMRGETELALIEEASISDEKDPNALSDEIVKEVANNVFSKWKLAQTQVFNPPTPAHAFEPGEHLARARPVPGQDDRKVGMRRLPRPAGHGRRAQLRQPGCFQRGRLRRQSQRAQPARGSTLPSTTKTQDPLEPEARRLGQPAPAGQPESRRLQGRAAADRHLLADRQGDQRRPDAGPLSLAAQRQRRCGTWSTSCWHCPTSPSCSRTPPRPPRARRSPRAASVQ